jgi:hypothetical protein
MKKKTYWMMKKKDFAKLFKKFMEMVKTKIIVTKKAQGNQRGSYEKYFDNY